MIRVRRFGVVKRERGDCERMKDEREIVYHRLR